MLRTGSAKKVTVILSPALGGMKDLEILRLAPQNDVVGQPVNPLLHNPNSHTCMVLQDFTGSGAHKELLHP